MLKTSPQVFNSNNKSVSRMKRAMDKKKEPRQMAKILRCERSLKAIDLTWKSTSFGAKKDRHILLPLWCLQNRCKCNNRSSYKPSRKLVVMIKLNYLNRKKKRTMLSLSWNNNRTLLIWTSLRVSIRKTCGDQSLSILPDLILSIKRKIISKVKATLSRAARWSVSRTVKESEILRPLKTGCHHLRWISVYRHLVHHSLVKLCKP